MMSPSSDKLLPHTVVIPSVVGTGRGDVGLLTLGRLGTVRYHPRPHQVDWGQGPYLVGEGTERFSRPLERMNLERLSDGADTRALTYATLGTLLGPGNHRVSIIVGFPVQILVRREQALAVLRGLRKWLKGEHTFTLDDVQVSLEIINMQAMAQPAGTLFAWGLNDEGQWVRNVQDLKTLTGILDIGFNTLDMLAVEHGQVVGQYTAGDTAGVRRATEILRQEVLHIYQVSISHHQADAFLHARRPVLAVAEGDIDLRPLVQQSLEHAGRGIQTFVESHWGNGRQFRRILVTGGGAPLFRKWILELFPHAVVLPEPVTANALGLARYGQRVFRGPEGVAVGLDPGFGGFKAAALEREG